MQVSLDWSYEILKTPAYSGLCSLPEGNYSISVLSDGDCLCRFILKALSMLQQLVPFLCPTARRGVRRVINPSINISRYPTNIQKVSV
jgi:hypothetical protein